MDISLEELKGFFDLDSGGMSIYLNASVHRTVYNCRVCYSLVLGGYIRNHVEWHLEHKRPDSSKTPAEIRAEARRELGQLTREQEQEILTHETMIGNPYPDLWDDGVY